MSAKVILYAGWYTPELCQAHRDKTFVFGDNTLRFGKGGQAVIRDEPNVLGVSTKRKPSMADGSFFTEGSAPDLDVVLGDLLHVWSRLKQGMSVVIPVLPDNYEPSLGLQRAELKERAPSIYETIQLHVHEMAAFYGSRFVDRQECL